MEFKKTILDRMVHLLSKGDVIPIIEFMVNCVNTQAADISLIRYFVMEVRLTLKRRLERKILSWRGNTLLPSGWSLVLFSLEWITWVGITSYLIFEVKDM